MNGIPTSIPGQTPLEEHDPEMFDIIEREKHRQWSGLELIASEVSDWGVLLIHLATLVLVSSHLKL